MDNAFLKVAHVDLEIFEKHFGNVELDAEYVIKTLLQLYEEREPAVYDKDGSNKRGTIHFDGGFGSQKNDMYEEDHDNVTSFPVLIHHKKPVYKKLYPSVHHVQDCAKVFMDNHAINPNGTKVDHNERKFNIAGKNLNFLHFYSVAVAIRLLKSDTAKRNLLHAQIKMTGIHGECLDKLGCDNAKKIKNLLEQAAEHLDLYVCDVKNGMRKAH